MCWNTAQAPPGAIHIKQASKQAPTARKHLTFSQLRQLQTVYLTCSSEKSRTTRLPGALLQPWNSRGRRNLTRCMPCVCKCMCGWARWCVITHRLRVGMCVVNPALTCKSGSAAGEQDACGVWSKTGLHRCTPQSPKINCQHNTCTASKVHTHLPAAVCKGDVLDQQHYADVRICQRCQQLSIG